MTKGMHQAESEGATITATPVDTVVTPPVSGKYVVRPESDPRVRNYVDA